MSHSSRPPPAAFVVAGLAPVVAQTLPRPTGRTAGRRRGEDGHRTNAAIREPVARPFGTR